MTEEPIGRQDRHDRRENWASQAVNWGQLVIALVVMVGGIFVDRMALDRRVTVVEVEQKAMGSNIDKETAAASVFKTGLSQRLDVIQAQLTQISVQMAASQSLGERIAALERQREREFRESRQQPGNGNGRR
jgi:hypothetical protein